MTNFFWIAMISCDLVNFVLQSLINGALVKNKRKPSPDSEFIFMQCAMLLLSDEKCHLFSGGCNAVFAICHAGTETTLCASNLCSSSHGYVPKCISNQMEQENATWRWAHELQCWQKQLAPCCHSMSPSQTHIANSVTMINHYTIVNKQTAA